MATVTGLTAARMIDIENASVVNGYIDEVGHLILITHGGLQLDAGPISSFTATEEAEGAVELATPAEVQAGTDTTRVVTPAGLASLAGYRYLQTLTYTSSGTFAKASYPGIKAARIRTVGAGGGGGGAPFANTGNHSAGGGGGGGGYAEAIIFEPDLLASEPITIGAGGTGGNTTGNIGGTTSFGTHVVATGGSGGGSFSDNALMLGAPGGAAGIGTVGNLLVKGTPGALGSGHSTLGHGGRGGSSALGGGGVGAYGPGGASSLAGGAGGNFGGGGGGAAVNASGSAALGGAGAPGVMIVEVYV